MMEKIDSNNIEQLSQIPPDVQLQLCKKAALAFGYLCKMVCEKFGQEGVKIIEESFLSDSEVVSRDKLYMEENSSREVGITLIKLLATWGINRSSFLK